MKRIYGLAAFAVVLFGMLVVIDTIKSDEPFDITSFAFDVVEKALLALAVVATAPLSFRAASSRSVD
jgi:hypothetical protein